MRKSIIFCQAPLKLSSVLDCYDKEKKKDSEVTIIVRNTKTSYDFLKKLDIDARILYFEIHNAPFYKYKRIKKSIRNDIELLKINEKDEVLVFFTDIVDDYLQGAYLSYLKKYPIYFIQSKLETSHANDRLSYKTEEKVSFNQWLKAKVYSILYNYNFKYVKIDHWTLGLNYKYKTIDCSDIKDVTKKYSYRFPVDNDKCVLFFTEPYRNRFQSEENYIELNKKIIEEVHSLGYSIGIKGHPRIGCLDAVESMADFEVPSYVPAEFVDMTKTSFVIGFVSSALCTVPSNIKAFSVLPLCEVTDQDEANYWYNYLEKLSGGKVVFLHSWKELSNIESND